MENNNNDVRGISIYIKGILCHKYNDVFSSACYSTI